MKTSSPIFAESQLVLGSIDLIFRHCKRENGLRCKLQRDLYWVYHFLKSFSKSICKLSCNFVLNIP